MYIKLIQPRMIKRPMDTDIKTHMAPPLGLLTIVNMLRDKHTVVLQNENIEDIIYDTPDIVGISVTVDTLFHAMEIAEKFRKKGVVVVAGGIHITTALETVSPDAFDAFSVGPAEGTWHDILEDLKKGELKKVYRCNGQITGKDIVSPAYDFLEKGKYLYCNVVHTSRGCPFKCDFCYNSGKEHMYVNREIDDVIRDIKSVKSKHIMFIDDNFAGNYVWLKEFLERIKPLDIKWNAAVSINVCYNEPLLDLMKDSGCQGLFIGFESINPISIGDVHKVQNETESYEKAIENVHKRGMMINASFVFGLDGDTKETFNSTLDWIVKNKIETVTSHILTPYPGTELYRRMKQEGRLLTDDLSLYNTANVVFEPKGMTKDELYDGYIKIYKDIYSIKNILKRMPEAKEQRAAYILFNLFYRKWGKLTAALCRIVTYERLGKLAEKVSKYL